MLDHPGNGLGHIAQLIHAIHLQRLHVLQRAHRTMHDRPFTRDKFEVQSHRRERQQQVSEDDRGIHAETLRGRDGHLGCDVGGAADVEQAVMLANGHVLGHVASGLPQEPYGCAIHWLPQACADEATATTPAVILFVHHRFPTTSSLALPSGAQ